MKESVRSKNVFEYLQEQGSLTIGEFNVMAEGYPSDFSFVPYGFVPEMPVDELLEMCNPFCDINAHVKVYSDRVVINNMVLPYVKHIKKESVEQKIDVKLINIPSLKRPIVVKYILGKKLIEEKVNGVVCKYYYTDLGDLLFYRHACCEKINSVSKYFAVLCLSYNKQTGSLEYMILFPEDLFVVLKEDNNPF